MSIITLLTDFGTQDEYVGVIKGVILSHNPLTTIVDITHHIDPQDVLQASYTLHTAYKYFPKDTIHMAVVDPGVGGDRAILLAKAEGYYFIAPDNGLLTLIMDDVVFDHVVRVENQDYFLKSVSQTFHGRDIFAPVAAHLSTGLDMKEIGPAVSPQDLIRLPVENPFISERNELIGSVISIDRFGNLITNIRLSDLEAFGVKKTTLEIHVGKHQINGLARSYDSMPPYTPLAIMGSHGQLEIAVNYGEACHHFGVEKGARIKVKKSDREGGV